MTERTDVVIIGAGHNGLVCAALLARAGRRVTVLEARERVGGMADTRPFAEGFSVSACAHFLYHMPFELIDELGLVGHGLTVDPRPLRTVSLAPAREPLVLDGHVLAGGGVGSDDGERYGSWREDMARFAGVLKKLAQKPPPRLAGGGHRDRLALARMGLDLRRLGRESMREFLRIIGMNVYDLLDESFDSAALKGALALDAVLGTHMGPRSPNTVFTLLQRLSGGFGEPAAMRQPIGGLGALSGALAASAREAGAVIRVGARVAGIEVAHGRAHGVVLADGGTIEADVIVSNADPRSTILELLGARHVETGFARRVNRFRARGTAAKLHLALRARPQIDGLDDDLYKERLVIAPDMDYIERAFDPVKYGQFATAPVCEVSLPCIADPALAPDGRHVLSAVVQYAPHDLAGGWTEDRRRAFADAAIATLERVMPGLGGLIEHRELLTPADIHARYGAHGGHWHHGELTLDQALFVRPVPGAQRYALPVEALYLCGAGTHPGGHVSGLPGRNAARAILSQEPRGGKYAA